jgi:hypothetical protein
MFEILLQADRALASGALDQAEQAYWQLIELDPSNAMAAAGLARVALLRDDRRLARTFADRALKVDPDNGAARKVMDALEGRDTGQPEETGLHVQAVQSLEALGRRRRSARSDSGGPAGSGKAARVVDEAAEAEEARAAEAEAAVEAVGEAAADEEAAAAAAAVAETSAPPARTPSRPTPADQVAPVDRAASRPAVPPRAPRSSDPFSQAETAATIEAIDAADEMADAAEAAIGQRVAEAADVEWDRAMATAAGELARVRRAEATTSEAELAAAERESAAQAADDTAPSRVAGAAAAAGAAAGAGGAAGAAAGRYPARGRFPAASASPTAEELEDELPDAVDSDEETSGRPIPIEAGAFGPDRTSEGDAEAEAMREAMDMIAKGEAGNEEPPDGQPHKGLFRRLRGG